MTKTMVMAGLLAAAALSAPATVAAQDDAFKANLEPMAPFMGDWRAIPPDERPETFYSSRRWTLDGAAIRTLEGFVRDGGFTAIVDNLTAWNPVEAEILFQEHAAWGNFVRGRIEVLGENRVRRHMQVWNVNGTYNLWWETFTYDPTTDTFTSDVRRVVEGVPQEQGAQVIRFVRVDSIPGLPNAR